MAIDIAPVAIKFIVFLAVMAAGAFGILLWVRRGGRVIDKSSAMLIRHRQALDARHMTWVVEVKGRTLLLGGGNGQLSCLADLTPGAATGAPQ